MFLILASTAVATSAATPVHSAEISYAFSACPASEETESTVRFHDVEPRFAMRASLSGSHAGSCDAAHSRINAEVARYSRALSGKSAAVAQRDRAILLRERDGVQALSVEGG